MKAFIEGFHWDWQVEIIKKLDIEPVLWCSSDTGTREQMPEGCRFIPVDKILFGDYAGLGEKEPEYINDEVIFNDADEIDKITRIIRIRKDLYGSKLACNEGELRRFVYKQIAYFMSWIDKINPDVVLFESAPHLVFHYALYYAAKKRGVRTVIINRVGEPARFFLAERVEELVPEKIVNEPSFVPEVFPVRQKPKYSTEGPSALKGKLPSFNEVRSKFNRCLKYKSIVTLSKILRKIAYKTPYGILYRYYSIDNMPSGNFVYFPLHESPEDTTYPSSWNFEDQVYAVEYLSQILPEEIEILVKEHPNQVFYRGRGWSFYSSLVKLKNVRLISKEIDTFALVDKCVSVATLTGQAGWEALTNGKPVIYFGQAWYMGAPGTMHVNEFKKLDRVQRKEFLMDRKGEDLQQWYINFHKRSFPGYLNNIMSTGSTQDSSLLAKGINAFLSNTVAHGIE